MHDAGANADANDNGGTRSLVASNAPNELSLRHRYGYGVAGVIPQEEEEDLASTLRRYSHILLKWKWLILAVAILFAALSGVRALLKTPLYLATVRIQIEREPAKVVDGGATAPAEAGNADFLRTQYELLKSRAMAERVVSSQRLIEDEDFFKARSFSLLGALRTSLSAGTRPESAPKRTLQARAVEIVLQNVSLNPVPGSRVVDISFLDPSPTRAQTIANAYAEAYIASNLDKRFQANSYAKTFLDDQIKQLKIRLEESEKALLDFAERERMVEVTDKASIADNNLAAANAALGQLISERIKNEQIWRQVENATAINLPQLLSNGVIEVLRAQKKALETEYQEKLESFKPGYPAMVQISNKLKEVDRQLATEVRTIKNSLKAAYETSVSQESEMAARIEALRSEVLDLQKKGIQYNILKREVETNRGLYNSLLQRYKEIDIAGGVGTNNVFIVDRAELPETPSEPNLTNAVLIFAILGVGAGIGLAFFIEMLDDRIRAPEDLEQELALSILGVIPRANSEGDCEEELANPRSPLSEAYRSLATALQFSSDTGLPRSISVTSTGPGEGKSTTVLAVARYFAQIGLKVLLVDADLRNPSLHTKLRLDNSLGLSNFLTGASLPPEVVQKTDHPKLAFMASGPLPPNAADLLSGPRLFSLISVGAEVFDLIVFDSPPMLGLADAQILASAVGGTIFAVAAGDKQKAKIKGALRRLQLRRITILGAVLTKFDAKTAGYGYAYGYDYLYDYDASPRSLPSQSETPSDGGAASEAVRS